VARTEKSDVRLEAQLASLPLERRPRRSVTHDVELERPVDIGGNLCSAQQRREILDRRQTADRHHARLSEIDLLQSANPPEVDAVSNPADAFGRRALRA